MDRWEQIKKMELTNYMVYVNNVKIMGSYCLLAQRSLEIRITFSLF